LEPGGSDNSRIRLPYLDGLRGVSALCVVINHVYIHATWNHPDLLPAPLRLLAGVFNNGQYAVDVFIVLSGYCLMMPAARSGGRRMPGSFEKFIVRRARRILPAYYASLIAVLLLMAAIPWLRQPSGTRQDFVIPVFTAGNLLSHATLLHNLNADWILKINPPLWSVATEWQIYFAFALLLVPIWSRGGIVLATLFAIALGCLPHAWHWNDGARFWMLGLFGMGMTAAVISFSSHAAAVRLRSAVPWGAFAAVLWLVGLIGVMLRREMLEHSPLLTDLYFGAAATVLIIGCTRAVLAARRPTVLRALESPVARLLGRISYSLYLVHWPILALLLIGSMRAGVSADGCLAILATAGVFLSLLTAWIFHRLFERPFMHQYTESGK